MHRSRTVIYIRQEQWSLAWGSWVGKERWEKERELSHELYNAGHLYETAARLPQPLIKKPAGYCFEECRSCLRDVLVPEKKSVAPVMEIVEMGLVNSFALPANWNTWTQQVFHLCEDCVQAMIQKQWPWKTALIGRIKTSSAATEEAVGHAVRWDMIIYMQPWPIMAKHSQGW